MALDINGYNASFNAFVKFADDSMRTNAKAVARFGEGGAQPLEGRTIVAVDPNVDKVGKWGRSLEQQDLNNKIRTAFKKLCFWRKKRIPAAYLEVTYTVIAVKHPFFTIRFQKLHKNRFGT